MKKFLKSSMLYLNFFFNTAKNDLVDPDSWKLTWFFQCFLYLVEIFDFKEPKLESGHT